MPVYRVTAKRKTADDLRYDLMLDMLEGQHQMAPINPGDDPRVYIITAANSNDAARTIGDLLDGMGYGDWPEHVAGFRAEGV